MAQRERKTARFRARAGAYFAAGAAFVLEVLGSFLNFREGDGLLARGKKTANLVIRRVAYFAADYGLAAVSAAVVVTAKAMGASFFWVFVALWMFDLVVAGAFVLFFEKTGEDLSLGVDFRRAVDTIHKRSRLAGYAAMLLVVGQAAVWTGPEKIVTFFRKEIGAVYRVVLLLLVLTATQSLVWATLYGLGYDVATRWLQGR